MKRYLMNSGGKDSMASCIIDFEKNGYGGSVDGVVMGELMFSHKYNIPAEHPISYKWKHEVAIPKLKEMGFNLIIVKSKEDYLSLFHKRYKQSKDKAKNGKKWGFEIADNIVYLVPLSKIFTSLGRIRKILNYGDIREIHILSASKCGFPFGFPACAIWLQKGYYGDTKIKEFINKGDEE